MVIENGGTVTSITKKSSKEDAAATTEEEPLDPTKAVLNVASVALDETFVNNFSAFRGNEKDLIFIDGPKDDLDHAVELGRRMRDMYLGQLGFEASQVRINGYDGVVGGQLAA